MAKQSMTITASAAQAPNPTQHAVVSLVDPTQSSPCCRTLTQLQPLNILVLVQGAVSQGVKPRSPSTVSYTHLTLPTIYSV